MAVTSTNNLRRGSKGEDVIELQKKLGFTGADVDGSFGPKTERAVRDYQQKNGLTVDGVVGTKTWGKLTNLNPGDTGVGLNPVNPGAQTASVQSTGSYNYAPYEPSDSVKQAEQMLQQQLANKPGAYTSPWQAQLDETLNKILNREPFSYDLNGDLLYQQYKDQAVTMGQQAAMDVMGQAQAMTGGYGNSYAQSVGQQTYQGHLQQLNDKIPELYQLALNQYNREGDELYNQYGMYADREAQDYGRYRDSVSDYYTELDRLTNDARYQSEQEYGKWSDKVNMDYAMHRDSVADKQWQAEFDEAKRQWELQFNKKSGGSSTNTNKTNKIQDAVKDLTDDVEDFVTPANRQEEIIDWVARMLANVRSASFDPKVAIKASSFLNSDAERDFAYKVVQEYGKK